MSWLVNCQSHSCISHDYCKSNLAWAQAQFSFWFVNNILAHKAKQKQSLIQTFYETSATHFFDQLTFLESANQNYFNGLFFFSMQIFHTGENCRLTDLKNSFSF